MPNITLIRAGQEFTHQNTPNPFDPIGQLTTQETLQLFSVPGWVRPNPLQQHAWEAIRPESIPALGHEQVALATWGHHIDYRNWGTLHWIPCEGHYMLPGITPRGNRWQYSLPPSQRIYSPESHKMLRLRIKPITIDGTIHKIMCAKILTPTWTHPEWKPRRTSNSPLCDSDLVIYKNPHPEESTYPINILWQSTTPMHIINQISSKSHMLSGLKELHAYTKQKENNNRGRCGLCGLRIQTPLTGICGTRHRQGAATQLTNQPR